MAAFDSLACFAGEDRPQRLAASLPAEAGYHSHTMPDGRVSFVAVGEEAAGFLGKTSEFSPTMFASKMKRDPSPASATVFT